MNMVACNYNNACGLDETDQGSNAAIDTAGSRWHKQGVHVRVDSQPEASALKAAVSARIMN